MIVLRGWLAVWPALVIFAYARVLFCLFWQWLVLVILILACGLVVVLASEVSCLGLLFDFDCLLILVYESVVFLWLICLNLYLCLFTSFWFTCCFWFERYLVVCLLYVVWFVYLAWVDVWVILLVLIICMLMWFCYCFVVFLCVWGTLLLVLVWFVV